jgi:hypothetical protein
MEKDLRLDSHFSTVCAFWPPEAPDEIKTGTLVVDNHGIQFTTAPTFTRQISAPDLRSEISLGGTLLRGCPSFMDLRRAVFALFANSLKLSVPVG